MLVVVVVDWLLVVVVDVVVCFPLALPFGGESLRPQSNLLRACVASIVPV